MFQQHRQKEGIVRGGYLFCLCLEGAKKKLIWLLVAVVRQLKNGATNYARNVRHICLNEWEALGLVDLDL